MLWGWAVAGNSTLCSAHCTQRQHSAASHFIPNPTLHTNPPVLCFFLPPLQHTVKHTVAKGVLLGAKASSFHLHIVAVYADADAWRTLIEPALSKGADGPRGLMLHVHGSCIVGLKPQVQAAVQGGGWCVPGKAQREQGGQQCAHAGARAVWD